MKSDSFMRYILSAFVLIWFSFMMVFSSMNWLIRIVCLISLFWSYYELIRSFRSHFIVKWGKGLRIHRKISEEYSVLNRVLRLINEERDLEEILRCIVDEAYELIPAAQSSSFVVYNPKTDMFEFKEVKSQSADFFEDFHLNREEVEKKFAGKTRPFIDNNVRKSDQQFRDETKDKFDHYGVPETILFIPIRIDGKLQGYISLDNWEDAAAFTRSDLYRIEQILPQLVLAYSRAIRNTELADYKNKLEQLYRAGQELAMLDQADQLIQHGLTIIHNTLNFNDSSIFLLEGEELIFKGGYKNNKRYKTIGVDLSIHEGICGWVARHGEPALVNDVLKDSRYISRANGIRSELVVPIKVGRKIFGVVNLESMRPNQFNKADKELSMTIASQLGIALSNMKHQNELKKALLQIITALAKSIETKDDVTGNHCERMEQYAVQIGKEMKLCTSRIEKLRQAAMLHDIGKIGVPGNILEKPGRLTPEEFKIMQEHPAFGANILREVDFLKGVAKIVEQHHERIDGKGYPKGISNEEITLEARIIAVVDAYDAMTSDRPYRRGLPRHEAIQELKKHSGTQFDSQVVQFFLEYLEREEKLTLGGKVI